MVIYTPAYLSPYSCNSSSNLLYWCTSLDIDGIFLPLCSFSAILMGILIAFSPVQSMGQFLQSMPYNLIFFQSMIQQIVLPRATKDRPIREQSTTTLQELMNQSDPASCPKLLTPIATPKIAPRTTSIALPPLAMKPMTRPPASPLSTRSRSRKVNRPSSSTKVNTFFFAVKCVQVQMRVTRASIEIRDCRIGYSLEDRKREERVDRVVVPGILLRYYIMHYIIYCRCC